MIQRAVRGPRLFRAALLIVAAASGAAPAAAQLARVTTSPPDAAKLLVVPFARDSADSALSIAIPDGLRDRMRLTRAQTFNVIPKAAMNEALVASGFQPELPLDLSVARQLARFLNIKVLVEGNILRRGNDSVLVIARLAEVSGLAPQSATASVVALRSRANGGTGGDLANRLADAYRSFEPVTNCRRSVDSLASVRREIDSTRLFTRAQQGADRALQQYPQSAGAHLCIALIRRAQSAPSDSILAHLQMAEDLDSLNPLILRQLARVYDERGDTVALLHELHHILKVEIRNDTLRINTARLFVQRGMADSAIILIDEALAGNPSSVILLNARSVALASARRWADAASTMALVAEVDSANIDSLFVFKITNYYQQVPDSANLLVWTRIATERLPTQASYLYSLAIMVAARGDTTSAIDAIKRYIELKPNDGRGMLTYAVWLSSRGQTDSSLAWAHRAADADSMLRPSAAGLFLRAGRNVFQDTTLAGPVRFQRTDSILSIGQPWATGQTRALVGYIRGLSQVQLASLAAQDAQANRSCDAVRRTSDLLTSAEANIIVGVSINREQANQILSQYIPQLRQSASGLQRQLRCT